MPLSIGQVLNNRYRIDVLLSQNDTGAVYRAWDLNVGIPVAVEECLDVSPTVQKQLKRKAGILVRSSHPDLPRVTDYFFLPEQGQYLVMDLVEGEDPQSILGRLISLPDPPYLGTTPADWHPPRQPYRVAASPLSQQVPLWLVLVLLAGGCALIVVFVAALAMVSASDNARGTLPAAPTSYSPFSLFVTQTPTPTPPSSPSPTPIPPTATPRPPTATPIPPTPVPVPPPCSIAVGGTFAGIWSSPSIYLRLGCPLNTEHQSPSAEEAFQRG